jgi:hypothetical protein
MTTQFNTTPTYDQPLTTKGQIATSWWRFWSGLGQGRPSGPTAGIVVGSSPFQYTATQGGTVIVNGGSTTQIAYSRDGANFFITGQTAGMFPLSQGDILKVTYPVSVPTMTFVPR